MTSANNVPPPAHRLAFMTVASVKPEAYRYLHEALGDISSRTSDEQQVVTDQEATGRLILRLDGTLIDIDDGAIRKVTGHDRDINDCDDPATFR